VNAILLVVDALPNVSAATLFADYTPSHLPRIPNLATLLTGRDVFAHRVAFDGDASLDEAVPTIAEIAAERGIFTAAAADLPGDLGRGVEHHASDALTACLAQPRPFLLLLPHGQPPPLVPDTLLVVVMPTRCMLTWPGRVPSGERRGGGVRAQDVAPTLLDALGLADAAMAQGLWGPSLLAMAETRDDRGTAVELYITDTSAGARRRSWRTRDWLLVEDVESGTRALSPRADAGRDVATDHPDVVRELTARMRGHCRRRCAETGLPDPLEGP
jgi:arylsulfatase A-like enzyme